MGLLGWFRRSSSDGESEIKKWHRAWEAAAAAADTSTIGTLRTRLDALGLSEDDAEIEREMLEGLQRIAEIESAIATGGLPVIETGHRVVGSEACHFTAPASMPDDPAQPSGRLLLTSGRAILVAGAHGAAIPWHTVTEATLAGRDLVLIRADRDTLHRFRCNSFGDAMAGLLLSRRLMAARRRTPTGL